MRWKINDGGVLDVVYRAGLCAFVVVEVAVLVQAGLGAVPWRSLFLLLCGLFAWFLLCIAALIISQLIERKRKRQQK